MLKSDMSSSAGARPMRERKHWRVVGEVRGRPERGGRGGAPVTMNGKAPLYLT